MGPPMSTSEKRSTRTAAPANTHHYRPFLAPLVAGLYLQRLHRLRGRDDPQHLRLLLHRLQGLHRPPEVLRDV